MPSRRIEHQGRGIREQKVKRLRGLVARLKKKHVTLRGILGGVLGKGCNARRGGRKPVTEVLSCHQQIWHIIKKFCGKNDSLFPGGKSEQGAWVAGGGNRNNHGSLYVGIYLRYYGGCDTGGSESFILIIC